MKNGRSITSSLLARKESGSASACVYYTGAVWNISLPPRRTKHQLSTTRILIRSGFAFAKPTQKSPFFFSAKKRALTSLLSLVGSVIAH